MKTCIILELPGNVTDRIKIGAVTGLNVLQAVIALTSLVIHLLVRTSTDITTSSCANRLVRTLTGSCWYDICDTVDVLCVFDVKTFSVGLFCTQIAVLLLVFINIVIVPSALFCLLSKKHFGKVEVSPR